MDETEPSPAAGPALAEIVAAMAEQVATELMQVQSALWEYEQRARDLRLRLGALRAAQNHFNPEPTLPQVPHE